MMKDASVPTKDEAIKMEIEIAAAPERVFRALTDPRQLMAWFGGSKHWEIDLRVGGRWVANGFDESCGDWEMKGKIVEMDPPRVLAYTWNTDVQHDRGLQTEVRYELVRTDKGTRLYLTHKGFAGNLEAFASYRGGWPIELDLLRSYAERQSV